MNKDELIATRRLNGADREIKVGGYVRLKYGKIDKVINNDYYMQQYIECEKGLYPRENITKHSNNILDLIEYGDVLKIKEDNSIAYLGLTKPETTIILEDIIEAIKEGKIELLEILTKEQYFQNCFRLEE